MFFISMSLESNGHHAILVPIEYIEKASQDLKPNEKGPFPHAVSNSAEDKVTVDTDARDKRNERALE